MADPDIADFDVEEAADTVASIKKNYTFIRAYRAAVRALQGQDAACYRASKKRPKAAAAAAVAAAKAQFGLDDAPFAEAVARGLAQVNALPESQAIIVWVARNKPSR